MGTIVTGIAVFGVAALIIKKMIRDKKKGKSIHFVILRDTGQRR